MVEPIGLLGTLGTYGGLVWQYFQNRDARRAAGETVEDDRLPQIVPPERRNIVGRARKLGRLRDIVKASNRAMITSGAVLQGEGGMGKTTMARHYAHKFGHHYKTGCWIRAEDQPAMFEDIMTYGAALFQFQVPKKIREVDVKAVLLGFEMLGQPMLLIYDNAEKLDDVTKFIPPGDHIDILITTRATGQMVGFDRLEMDAMDVSSRSSEGVALLLQEAGEDDAGEAIRGQAWELARVLGGLPLALVIAGAMVRQGEKYAELGRDITRLLEETPAEDGGAYRDSVSVAVKLSYDRLSLDAKGVADTCAWFAAEGIEARLFTDAPGGDWWDKYKDDIPPVWQGMLADAARVRRAFAELRGLSILRAEAADGLHAMHRLTAAVLRLAQPEKGERFARAAAVLVRACYPYDADDPEHWPACRRLTPHGATIWQGAEALWDGAWGRPGWAAMDSLLNQMGVYYSSQENAAAEIAAKRASLAVMEARVEEVDRALPVALGNLGQALSRANAFAEAEDMLNRAVDLDREHRPEGEDLPARLIQRANLEFRRLEAGAAADQEPDLGIALKWLEEARDLVIATQGEAHPNVALAWNEIGYLHRLAGRKTPMAEAVTAAYEIMAAVPDGNQARLASYATNAGASWLEAKDAEKAAPLLREAWEIFGEIYRDNPGHSGRKLAAGWYCSCLLVLGEAAAARDVAEAGGLDWEEEVRKAEQYKG